VPTGTYWLVCPFALLNPLNIQYRTKTDF